VGVGTAVGLRVCGPGPGTGPHPASTAQPMATGRARVTTRPGSGNWLRLVDLAPMRDSPHLRPGQSRGPRLASDAISAVVGCLSWGSSLSPEVAETAPGPNHPTPPPGEQPRRHLTAADGGLAMRCPRKSTRSAPVFTFSSRWRIQVCVRNSSTREAPQWELVRQDRQRGARLSGFIDYQAPA
jgi:hypothetical protein